MTSNTRLKRPWPTWGRSYTVGPQTYIDIPPASRNSSSATCPDAVSCNLSMQVRYAEMAPTIPEKPGLEGLEEKWGERWEAEGTYRFDRRAGRDEIYAIDTPPPTVSGSLHLGHVASYTHTD